MSYGHKEDVVILGDRKNIRSRISYFEKHGLCKECYRKQRDYVFLDGERVDLDDQQGALLYSFSTYQKRPTVY